MSAPPYTHRGCTRHLKLDLSAFAWRTYFLKAQEIGELFQMLMAEVGGQPIPSTSNVFVKDVFDNRGSYRKIKGSFRRRTLSLAVREAVFVRDGARCRYCMEGLIWDTYRCDHIIPVARGGGDALKNLTASCRGCNQSKGAKLLSEWVFTR